MKAEHIEIDLILGCKESKFTILSWDDRKPRKRYMTKVDGKTTKDIRKGIRRLMDTMPREVFGWKSSNEMIAERLQFL